MNNLKRYREINEDVEENKFVKFNGRDSFSRTIEVKSEDAKNQKFQDELSYAIGLIKEHIEDGLGYQMKKKYKIKNMTFNVDDKGKEYCKIEFLDTNTNDIDPYGEEDWR
jgi:hypothetical protein